MYLTEELLLGLRLHRTLQSSVSLFVTAEASSVLINEVYKTCNLSKRLPIIFSIV